MKTSEIQRRDPYIYTDLENMSYYKFGTTDKIVGVVPGKDLTVIEARI
ncbi:MAG: hypothetical protein ACK2T1_04055 [Candidatus Promineifilaceae bacterium]